MFVFGRIFQPLHVAVAITLVAALPAPTFARPITIDAAGWDIGGEAQITERDGRTAIHIGPGPGEPLKGGEANLRNMDFSTGTIESTC